MSGSSTYNLSKSRYCCGVQCPKMLWLKKNKPEEFDDSVINQVILDNGSEVGDLAMGLLGDYVEVPYSRDLSQMIADTERLMSEGIKIIAEASFSYDNLFCSVDILKNGGDGHVELYEVKSSTEVKEIYHHDVAYQAYVLMKLGFMVDKACLVHINNQYVRHGAIELDKMFVIEDITDIADSLYDEVEHRITQIREIMDLKNEPVINIAENCKKPYECGFWKYCTADLPSPNVFDLCGTFTKSDKKWKWFRDGYVSFEDLLRLDAKSINANSRIEAEHGVRDLAPHIDVGEIRKFMSSIYYPLYFLDFESITPAIPLFDDSRPYQQICFQYSLHYIEEEGGELKHKEFLAYPGKDPRRDLCEQLCKDIPLNACTLVYNKGFERGRIKEMAEIFPDLADHLMNIHGNIVDLMIPFSRHYYYCRAMNCSYSIKLVLPALFPDDPALDYHNLEGVHNGGEASDTFVKMEQMSTEELEKHREYLLKYCGLDTYAMVKIWEKLTEVCR